MEWTGIKTLLDLAPQMAGVAVMVILLMVILKRALPSKDERIEDREAIRELSRTLREINNDTVRHSVKIEDHERRITTHDEAIQGLAQQVQTTIASGRH